jgi:hypothetical protein
VLARRDEIAVALFGLAWALAFANFAWWWPDPAHIVTLPRLVITSAVLGVSLLMPWWLLTAVRRMRQQPSLSLLFSSGDARVVHRTVESLVATGLLATGHPVDDLRGSRGASLVRVTPAGRRCLVAAVALLRGHERALDDAAGHGD